MKEEDIYQRLNVPLSINEYRDVTLPFLEMTIDIYKARYTSFKNITFSSLVHFKNTELSVGLLFEDCHFLGPLIFSNISTNGYDQVLNPDSQSIVFKNCVFRDSVQFLGKDSIIERTVLFESSTFEKGLQVSYMNIGEEGLIIRNCNIKEKCDLYNITVKQNISIEANKIECYVRFEMTSCASCTIVGENVFNDSLRIYDVTFYQGIIFNEGLFKKEVIIDHVYSEEEGLVINETEFLKSVFVNFRTDKKQINHGIRAFYIADSIFNNGIYIDGTGNTILDYPDVEKIEIPISSKLKGDIVFRNLNVGAVFMSGYNTSANIFLDNLFINQIRIHSLINNAGLVFSMIKALYADWSQSHKGGKPRRNGIYINDSNLGKAQFYQVDFSSFEKVFFHNNIFTDISTSLVKWFNSDQLEREEELGKKNALKEAFKSRDMQNISNAKFSLSVTYRSKQEVYRQLKISSQRQGDIPQALEFQKHEMNYYKKIVALRKPIKLNEYLILWSNQSNDFGQNWIKALGLLLLFSFICYLPIGFLTSENLNYSEFANSWSDLCLNIKVIFYYNIKNWIVLLNPIHHIRDINEDVGKFTNWIYFWDLISRIIVSYFLFQMISAFRKFNK